MMAFQYRTRLTLRSIPLTFPPLAISATARQRGLPDPVLVESDPPAAPIVIGRGPTTAIVGDRVSRTICRIGLCRHPGSLAPHATVLLEVQTPQNADIRHNGQSLVLDQNDVVVLEHGDRISLFGDFFEYVVQLDEYVPETVVIDE